MFYRWISRILLLMSLCTVTSVAAQDTGDDLRDLARNSPLVQEIETRLDALPEQDLVRLLLIGGGLALMFLGWRFYGIVVGIGGALVGGVLVTLLMPDAHLLAIALAMLLGAVLGVASAVFIYQVGIVLVGLYTGAIITAQLIAQFEPAINPYLLIIGGAIIGGITLLILSFELLIVISAILGGQMLAQGLELGIGWAVLFMIISIVIQAGLRRRTGYNPRRRRAKQD